jgi:DNA-directed RNA polymerase specialized sigma24 family protein
LKPYSQFIAIRVRSANLSKNTFFPFSANENVRVPFLPNGENYSSYCRKMDAEGNLDMFLLAAVILVAVLRARRRQARPQHNSVLTDWLYYAEIVATEYVNRLRQVARMDKETFILLKENFQDGGHRDSELCTGEKIMILLHVLRGYTNRETAERWQHSGSTISEAVHEVSHYLDNINLL